MRDRYIYVCVYVETQECMYVCMCGCGYRFFVSEHIARSPRSEDGRNKLPLLPLLLTDLRYTHLSALQPTYM